MSESASQNRAQPAAIIQTFTTLKHQIPTPHKLDLVRPRLISHLNEGASKRLTLVNAPMGYGKTTLLSQWARNTSMKVGWVTIEKGDNDPTRFLSSLIDTLQTIDPNVGKTIFRMLQSQKKPSIEKVLKRLVNDISLVMQDFAVAFEDYHFIHNEPVHNLLAYLLTYSPPQMHLIISGQTEPPFHLAQLRSDEQLKEIRSPYLAFTTEEASKFFNDLLELKIAFGEVTALVEKTKALPAGLKYVGLCLKNFANAKDFIAESEQSEQEMLSFALEVILKHQAEDVRQFVQRSSILDYLCVPLCNAVTGGSNSKEILKKLSENDLLIEAVDEQRNWFRWQPHLREHLVSLTEDESQSTNLRELHTRASLWYAQNRLVEPAFHHALQAEDYDLAGQYLEQNALNMLQNGLLVTVTNWLEELPDKVLQNRPMLSVCQAWLAIITQKTQEVETHLETALNSAKNAQNPREIIEHVSAIREYLTNLGRQQST